jgi:hypothetical protein
LAARLPRAISATARYTIPVIAAGFAEAADERKQIRP